MQTICRAPLALIYIWFPNSTNSDIVLDMWHMDIYLSAANTAPKPTNLDQKIASDFQAQGMEIRHQFPENEPESKQNQGLSMWITWFPQKTQNPNGPLSFPQKGLGFGIIRYGITVSIL